MTFHELPGTQCYPKDTLNILILLVSKYYVIWFKTVWFCWLHPLSIQGFRDACSFVLGFCFLISGCIILKIVLELNKNLYFVRFFFFNEVVSTLISLKCYLNFAEVSTKTKKKNSSIVTGKYKIMETLLEWRSESFWI